MNRGDTVSVIHRCLFWLCLLEPDTQCILIIPAEALNFKGIQYFLSFTQNRPPSLLFFISSNVALYAANVDARRKGPYLQWEDTAGAETGQVLRLSYWLTRILTVVCSLSKKKIQVQHPRDEDTGIFIAHCFWDHDWNKQGKFFTKLLITNHLWKSLPISKRCISLCGAVLPCHHLMLL